jgi:hypothetical protein
VSKGGLLYRFPSEPTSGRASPRIAGLLAAVAENPALPDLLRKGYEHRQRWAEREGIDPAVATLVPLAAEGALRERVLERLASLKEGSRE